MDPRNYFIKDSLWFQLQKYIREHHESYGLEEDCTEQQIIDRLESLADKNLSVAQGISKKTDKKTGKLIEKELDKELFKKALKHLISGKSASFRRYDTQYSYDNLYLLCYVLGLNLNESNTLLREYLHENALSARSLKEFIILFGLEKGIRWTAVRRTLNEYDAQINLQKQAPNNTLLGRTLDFQDEAIDSMDTIEDLISFLSKRNNLDFFSRLRNTHYLALLDYGVRIEQRPRGRRVYRLVKDASDWDSFETMKERYHYLFGLYPAYSDENTPVEEDVAPYLDITEIEELARIFGDTFLRYGKFCDIVQRKCVVEPCQETFLLFIIEKMDDEDYSSKESFIENCNSFLNATAFPSLNPSYAFNRLVLDVYDETALHNQPVTKSKYLSTLRLALRDIIDYKLHPDKWKKDSKHKSLFDSTGK